MKAFQTTPDIPAGRLKGAKMQKSKMKKSLGKSAAAIDQDRQIKQAAELLAEAATLKAGAANHSSHVAADMLHDAEMQEKAAERMMEIRNRPDQLPGGEMAVYDPQNSEAECNYLTEIGSKPMVKIRASSERLDLIEDAGVLALATDAAASIENPNSFEKMLAHEMATAHQLAMKMCAQANRNLDEGDQIDTIHTAFLLGQASKLMKMFQTGMQTLVKSKKGGRQEMVVQHIHVEKDAKAVVAGKMDYPAQHRGDEFSEEEEDYEE